MCASLDVRRSFVFLLLPEFTMIAFAMAIEPLRLANRILGHSAYQWRLASVDGLPVTASNGVQCAVDTSLAEERIRRFGAGTPSMIVVCSGLNAERYRDRRVFSWLRERHARGVAIGGLCTGAHVLANAGLLTDRRCAIHWENLSSLAEAFPRTDVRSDLYEIDDNIYTCAGGTASLDMMLKLIGDDFGSGTVDRICEQALTDRVRDQTDRQRLPMRARLAVQNAKVLRVIERMERSLAEPEPLVTIAASAALSRRQVERLFRQEMGCSPARYYLGLRLDKAQQLLRQSTLPVVEIAIACGFVSASHFSKCYREMYGRSPHRERAEHTQLIAA